MSISREELTDNYAKTDYQLIVDNVPSAVRENNIRRVFHRFGVITQVRIIGEMHRALVTFSESKALPKALAADPLCLKGANLRVSLPDDNDLRCGIR